MNGIIYLVFSVKSISTVISPDPLILSDILIRRIVGGIENRIMDMVLLLTSNYRQLPGVVFRFHTPREVSIYLYMEDTAEPEISYTASTSSSTHLLRFGGVPWKPAKAHSLGLGVGLAHTHTLLGHNG